MLRYVFISARRLRCPVNDVLRKAVFHAKNRQTEYKFRAEWRIVENIL